MYNYISSKPTFYLSRILTKNEEQFSVFPLSHEKGYYFFTARYALASGLRALGIGPNDTVLLPSYTCGVEIDTILNCNINPVFYRVNKDLLVDIDDLLKKINKNVKAILVTHFLGFPQPIHEIKKICLKKNLFLIEDCAHALLSTYEGNYLGSYGDVSVFSVLKTLPIPDGGVLIINNKDIKYNHHPEKPNLFSTIFYVAIMLNRRTSSNNPSAKETCLRLLSNGLYHSMASFRLLLVVFRKLFNQKGLYLVRSDSYLFIRNLSSWGISSLSRNIINKTDFGKIKSIRQKNFEYLLNHFLKNERGILHFRKLPSGVCPLFFPIIIENAEKRGLIYNLLKEKGIITQPWWDRFHPKVPWDQFPDAVYLKQRLLGLPIHQDLTFKHLDRVINEFEKAYQKL